MRRYIRWGRVHNRGAMYPVFEVPENVLTTGKPRCAFCGCRLGDSDLTAELVQYGLPGEMDFFHSLFTCPECDRRFAYFWTRPGPDAEEV